MKRNWDKLIAKSEYLTLLKIKELYDQQKFAELGEGLNKLCQSVEIDEKSKVYDHLEKLMTLILKGKIDRKYKIGKWLSEIRRLRFEISALRKLNDCITDEYINDIWNEVFAIAKEYAEILTQKKCNFDSLTWDEVFKKQYSANYKRVTPIIGVENQLLQKVS